MPENKTNESKKIYLNNIKSKYILEQVLENIDDNQILKLIKYNKSLQTKLDKDINTYKEYYTQIKIEVIPKPNSSVQFYGTNTFSFINIPDGKNQYFHFYFNDKSEEVHTTRFDNKVFKILIKIDEEIKSLKGLFQNCAYIEKIRFINCRRNDINDLSYMFSYCLSLKEIEFKSFITENVTNMSTMFMNCSLLKEIDLKNFNTENVNNFSNMFMGCSSLKQLDISSFKFSKNSSKNFMFSGCSRKIKDEIKSHRNDIEGWAFLD